MQAVRALLLGAASACCLAASPVWSQERGAYVGASIGSSEMKDHCEGVSISCDDKNKGWRLFGGYQFNPNLAAEAAYVDLGKTTASGTQGGVAVNGEVKSKAWELVGLGMWPLARELSIFAKLGFYHADTDSTASAAVPGFSSSGNQNATNTGVTGGFGVQVSFMRNFAARAEWQRYSDVGGDNTGKTDIDVLSAGILFRF